MKILASLGLLLLAGCTTYTSELESTLTGKSPAEQRQILKAECENQSVQSNRPGSTEHVKRMAEICDSMVFSTPDKK